MFRTLLAVAITMSGCVEYGINKPHDETPPAGDGDTSLSSVIVDTAETAEPEDSGDAGIIEDVDDPGDDTGTIPVPEPEDCEDFEVDTEITIDEDCHTEPVTGEMSVVIEWSKDHFSPMHEYAQILNSPVVGQLNDDNEDGLINDADIPDIVANYDDGGSLDNTHGILRWVSGDGSTTDAILERYDDTLTGDQFFPYRYAGTALGDIDADGITEIVTLLEKVPGPPEEGEGDGSPPDDPDHPVGPPPPPSEGGPPIMCHPAAIQVDGTIVWVATEWIECGGHTPALADLEGDGDIEVVIGAHIFDGVTGVLDGLGTVGAGWYEAYPEIGMISAVSDLNGDGIQEILAGSTIYSPDGEVVCSRSDDTADGYTASADFNLDGYGQVVVVGNNQAAVMNRHCEESATWVLPGEGTGGPPTVADFDSDGVPEIGIATATHYAVYEADGTELWTHPVEDASSHATGSTVFDFEGDGRPEVVYADETHLYVLDGPTGDVRLSDTEHTSRTLHEYPLVVDVDNDGYPEIVVPNGGGHDATRNEGLYVIGSGDDSWLGGRTTWNQHAYNIVNINDDLSIPSDPESNWPLHNNFRSGDLNPVYGTDAPDAIPLADVCTAECEEGRLIVSVRLGNQGTATLRHDMRMTFYRVTSTDWVPIEVLHISPPIYPGFASDAFEIVIDLVDVGTDHLAIIVDDDDGLETVRECDEANNTLILEDATCG
jgi:hypothetical protein